MHSVLDHSLKERCLHYYSKHEHNYRHLYPPTHTHTDTHTHCTAIEAALIVLLTASPDLPFVTVPFKKTCFNGNDFQKNIEPIMENVLQQLRSPSSKGRKQKRGQTTSVTFRLPPLRLTLPSSGRLLKAHWVSIRADPTCAPEDSFHILFTLTSLVIVQNQVSSGLSFFKKKIKLNSQFQLSLFPFSSLPQTHRTS
ncbi:hypothetical protein ATANTOWER_025148 [Ataeniobius toweri]|uniref:Uncharacterized protein n=1 Tax=Ataeniobius toweri TaxID=208326 RepID=A0ABU7A2X9_9TELE|nr:hypothetical protein [Ataeniobius toweri]